MASIKHFELRKLVHHPKPATQVNTGPRDDVSRSEYPARNGRNFSNTLKRIWKEVAVTQFELLFWISLKGLM
jgi:hypothetical protein